MELKNIDVGDEIKMIMNVNRMHAKRIMVFWLGVILFITLCPMLPFRAKAAPREVRVGWHEEPYFIKDHNGRASGYSYEYQQKIAAYVGWEYHYVEGGWAELTEKLKTGEIDLLANMSYSEERAKDYLFSSFPMGTESYYVYVSPNNQEITSAEYHSLDGKRVGVSKGTIQTELFLQWEKEHNVKTELIETRGTEEESLRLLGSELDAFVTMDVYADPKTAVPVWKIGASDYYFAVSKKRPELLAELNDAMSRIQDENAYYNYQLSDKYLNHVETNLYLSVEEQEWLSGHGKIRIGYQDNYLAFCAKDPSTGELIGALKDFLDYSRDVLENAKLEYEAIAYPTAAEAMEALGRGEVDCVFPANLTPYDAEMLGLVTTPAIMKTEMDAVVRSADAKGFFQKDPVIVTVNKGNTNYEVFLQNYFPKWQVKYFEDTEAGLHAIANGEADCVIVSNYRYSNIEKLCMKLQLVTVYSGVDLEYYVAVQRGNTQLYSILTKVISVVPDSVVHAALTYYSAEDAKTSFKEFLANHMIAVLIIMTSIILVILILLIVSIRWQKKAIKEHHVVEDLNKQVYVDALTHVRNKGGFDKYVEGLNKKIAQGEITEFAVGMFDCNDLKVINDKYGHEKGDVYLKTATRLICRIFRHSPVFRIGGDEFAVILTGEDFSKREELIKLFETGRRDACAMAENAWEQVHIAVGIAVYDQRTDRSIDDALKRADELMYENKRILKEKRYREI